MKKIMAPGLAAILLTIGSVAVANAASPYVALKVGHNIVDSDVTPKHGSNDTNNSIYGFIGGAIVGVGFDISDMIAMRTDLEYNYAYARGELHNNQSKSTLTDHKILLNGYLDFGGDKWHGFNPYVGVNIAYAIGSLDNSTDVDIDGFGLGFSVGTSYAICDSLAADLGFRWLSMARRYDEDIIGRGDFDTDELTMSIGMRYTF